MRPPSLLQILLLVLLVVLIFGAKRLPDVASSIGKSLKIFKKEVTELREDDAPTSGQPGADDATRPSSATTPPADTVLHERRRPEQGEDPGARH